MVEKFPIQTKFAVILPCGIVKVVLYKKRIEYRTYRQKDRGGPQTDFAPMTVSNPELPNRPTAPSPDTWLPEDEIDLRQYVLVLVAWWREIVLIALLTAVVAAALVLLSRFLLSPVYASSATVAIARTQSNISFDERFQTTVAQGDATANLRVIDYTARRSALVGLVASGNVAQAVIDQLGEQLDEEEREPAQLLGQVSAELSKLEDSPANSTSDLILITVEAASAEKAAAIANAWAENYVALINKLYGEVPAELVASVEMELGLAQTTYEQAQSGLEEFIASNEIARFDRLIAEKQDIIQRLQQGKQTAITTLVDEELAARSQIISAYINAQASNRLLTFNKEQEGKRQFVTTLIETEFDNRLNAFQSDQTARRRLFDQYVDVQTQNQMLALTKDQEARRQIFAQYSDTQIRNLLLAFATDQEVRTQLFQQYTSTQIDNLLLALATDQDVRQRLFSQYTTVQLDNQLLALSKDQEIRRKLFEAYVDSLVSNRLLAVQKDQEGRARLFAQYVNTEIENRLKALSQEQTVKSGLFQAYADADLRAKVTVFNEQVENKLETLGQYYESRRKLERLLKDAEGLSLQTNLAGGAGSASNGLALMLLKAEVFASSSALPVNLQLRLDNTDLGNADDTTQGADASALISVIKARMSEMDRLIAVQARSVLNNEGYDLLAVERPVDDPLFAALQQQYQDLFEVGSLAKAADETGDSSLVAGILQKYESLFAVDALAQSSDSVWQESELLNQALTKYQELFKTGDFAAQSGALPQDLTNAIGTRYQELFQLGSLSSSATITNNNQLSNAILAKYAELFSLGELVAQSSLPDQTELSASILTKYQELFALGDLATQWEGTTQSDLSNAILSRYEELFGLGALASASTVFSSTTPIFESIQRQYPDLFDTGALSALTEQMAIGGTPLALLSEERAKELLQLQGLEDVPNYTASAEPLLQAIDKLEKEIQSLTAQREGQTAQRDQLIRRRDLALSTLNTLRNKSAELNLTRTVTNSELRFASPAVEPLEPVEPVARLGLITTTALAGIVGLMLAVFVIFFANFMGAQPWLGRREPGLQN